MPEDPKLLQSGAASQTTGFRVGLKNLSLEWRGTQHAVGLRSAPLFLLTAVLVGVVAFSVIKVVSRSEVKNAALETLSRIHLLEEPEAASVAPSSLRVQFEWRDGYSGNMLSWDPLPNKLRIYRTPSGTSRYVEVSGRVGLLLDTDLVPGRGYVYVACAIAEQGHEYCSNPVGYEVSTGNWR